MNVIYPISNTYDHNMSRCRNMHRYSLMHNKMSPFASARNLNYVFYICNKLGYRCHECRSIKVKSHDNRYSNYDQHGNEYRAYRS